jgi:enoyl-CoA hydratase/carnithine racemase
MTATPDVVREVARAALAETGMTVIADEAQAVGTATMIVALPEETGRAPAALLERFAEALGTTETRSAIRMSLRRETSIPPETITSK